jgi:peptidoglycan/xylan/chitin deacetylase (PgdA/CDA1 family)
MTNFRIVPTALCLMLLSLIAGCTTNPADSNTPPINKSPQYVILKLDDLNPENGRVHAGWLKTFEYLNEQQVIATIGLIGESLENDNQSAYFDWVKQQVEQGHEIWNHGYCHCREDKKSGFRVSEFKGTDEAHQYKNLQRTQQLAKQRLGISLSAFGAPYNATDENTAKALDQIPEIKTWMFKETSFTTSKKLLTRDVALNIEAPVHIPNEIKFIAEFPKYQNQAVITIQGHPRSWVKDKKRWESFTKIIQFLKSQNIQFTTPQKLLKAGVI